MKRVLVLRLLGLEIVPMIGALALSAYSPRLMPIAFAVAAFAILVSVLLSLHDGAVLRRSGSVVERKNDRAGFWVWITAHFSFGAFCLTCAAVTFFNP